MRGLPSYFYPRSPCGERLRRATGTAGSLAISIHALLAESDLRDLCDDMYLVISIHALLAESDNTACSKIIPLSNFYPRSPCGERPLSFFERNDFMAISIHALLAESDKTVIDSLEKLNISIHALLAESDKRWKTCLALTAVFLSTLSLRRATWQVPARQMLPLYFYPRSPCGERRWKDAESRAQDSISIHALLAESDCQWRRSVKLFRHFYPRSPCGERPPGRAPLSRVIGISIHALLAESDAKSYLLSAVV